MERSLNLDIDILVRIIEKYGLNSSIRAKIPNWLQLDQKESIEALKSLTDSQIEILILEIAEV